MEKEILDCGNSLAMHEIAKSIGITQVIKESFQDVDSIMSLACFHIFRSILSLRLGADKPYIRLFIT